jgi:hypothetical protein
LGASKRWFGNAPPRGVGTIDNRQDTLMGRSGALDFYITQQLHLFT